MKKGRLMVGRLKGETEGERKKKTEGKKEGGRGWRDMDSFFRHHSQFRPTYDPEGVFSDLMIVLCGTVGSLMALILYTSVQWWYMVVYGGTWWSEYLPESLYKNTRPRNQLKHPPVHRPAGSIGLESPGDPSRSVPEPPPARTPRPTAPPSAECPCPCRVVARSAVASGVGGTPA